MTEQLLDPALIQTLIENGNGLIPMQFEPFVQLMTVFTQTVTALLGGIIGFYIISFIIRWYHDRKILNELRALRRDIDELKQLKRNKKETKVNK
ncbi:MAG TPA: hypothetical protein VJB66_00940 [Candidatus Nanoarchaeia archaeon]|nr:hypothetical protein [Candidatus Nanoarchaeia archaeon]